MVLHMEKKTFICLWSHPCSPTSSQGLSLENGRGYRGDEVVCPFDIWTEAWAVDIVLLYPYKDVSGVQMSGEATQVKRGVSFVIFDVHFSFVA